MIRVNLGGSTSKKPAAAGKPMTPKSPSGPTNLMPVVHLLIVVAAAAVGYMYYAQLTTESADLGNQISQLQEQQRELDAIIKQGQVYEVRRRR
jgi:hypothetical protein